MKYDTAIAYHLSEDQFEEMANSICQNILGMGVISFSKGRDGGKDGRFTGTANAYPSSNNPWNGKIIIQAKHTSNLSASCLCGDFYSNKDSVINKEIARLITLKTKEEFDYYLMFTNRKYTGGADCEIRKKISTNINLSIENIEIIGIETLNSILSQSKDIVKRFQLDKYHVPFDFSDEEIKDIILAFKTQLPQISTEIKNEAEKIKFNFDKIKIEQKNKKNKLGEEYYKNEILLRSLTEFDKIQRFLENPINEELKESYFDIATELSGMITLKMEDFDAFEELFIYIYQIICDGTNQLKGSKRHVTTLLHYMYFECLIGTK